MKLHVDDETIERPTAADLQRMVTTLAPHGEWSLALERDDGVSIEADATPDKAYEVSYVQDGTLHVADRPMDGDQLRAILELFLADDATWREHATWKPWTSATPAKTFNLGAGPRWWVMAGVPLLAIGGMTVAPYWLNWVADRMLRDVQLPAFMDSTAAKLILGFFGLVVAMFVVALAVKIVEMRKAAKWPRVMGRIVSSEAGIEERWLAGEKLPQCERVAQIAYTYEVGEESYRGTRFTLAEKVAESEVPDVLARYPVGKSVPVFYDPTDPANAVLERDAPSGLLLGCLGMLVAGCVGAAGLMFLVTQGPEWISTVLPNSVPALVILPGFGGLFLSMLGIGMLRASRAALAWPTVQGRITQSEVASGGVNKGYRPIVEFTYSVKGRDYRSRSVILDTVVGGSRGYAEKRAQRYPVGRIVKVFYDPSDPGRAALEIHSGPGWWVLGLGIALLAVALLATGRFIDLAG